jgi:hypothetical protein
MATSKAREMAHTKDSKELLLELGLLEGDEEGWAKTSKAAKRAVPKC